MLNEPAVRTAGSGRGFEILPWDSAQFGFPVARVASTVHPRYLEPLLRDARAANVGLAYYSIPTHAPEIPDAVLRAAGGRLISTRMTYIADLAERASFPGSFSTAAVDAYAITSYEGSDAHSQIVALARASGEYSRFRVDPGIDPRIFHAIYDAWIVRSVRREIAEEVLVARASSGIVGLVTLGTRGDRGDIGLLAVDGAARGRGIGRALVGAAQRWTVQRGLSAAQVVTQAANEAACRLYASAGYTVERMEREYHFWLRPASHDAARDG